jgi:hypothetical protein
MRAFPHSAKEGNNFRFPRFTAVSYLKVERYKTIQNKRWHGLCKGRLQKGNNCAKNTVKQDLSKLNRSVNSVLTKNAVAKNRAKSDTIEAKDGTNSAIDLTIKLLTLSQEKDPLSES